MLTFKTDGTPVHFPSSTGEFSFDEEVASIFDDMAKRSIPMYEEAHRLHVSLLFRRFSKGSIIVDVGSSTGMFFREIERQAGVPLAETGIVPVAIDSSEAMIQRVQGMNKGIRTLVGDISELPDLPEKADVMCALYVLQFVPEGKKEAAMDWLVRNTKIGGCIVLGQKEAVEDAWHDLFTSAYYAFRRDNGYTQEEIDAKAKALSSSMWPSTKPALDMYFARRGVITAETTRWMQFSTYLGVKVSE